MHKKLLIIASMALVLYGAEGDREIAKDKSGFFIGGKLGTLPYLRTLSSEGSIFEGSPPSISGLTCVPIAGGGIHCSGSGGGSIGGGSSSTTTFSNNPQSQEWSSMTYGGRFGYNYFFTPRNGLRVIASFETTNFDLDSIYFQAGYTYKVGVIDSKDNRFYTASIGLDYLFDFTKGKSPFGLFVGAGYDYNFGKMFEQLEKKDNSNLDITHSGAYVNFGVSQTIARRVRLDVGYKLFYYDYFKGSYQTNSTETLSGGKIKQTDISGNDSLSPKGLFYIALDFLF